MKPTLCSRCKKNLAVIFITKVENGQTTNEGLCLKCAKEMGIKQVDEIVERMGITDEDLDGLSNEMADQEMLFEVAHGLKKSTCCERLLAIAKNRGAPDNVTVTLAVI